MKYKTRLIDQLGILLKTFTGHTVDVFLVIVIKYFLLDVI